MEILGYKIERIRPQPPTQNNTSPPTHGKRMRLTQDTASQMWGLASAFAIEAPADAGEYWRRHDLDTNALKTMSVSKLVEYMIDISPEISKAVWDYMRFCNPGYTATAVQGQEPNKAGQAMLDSFIAELDDMHGSFGVAIGRLFMGGVVRGSFLAELVLDETGRFPVDLATPDPHIVRFRKKNDAVRGQVWEMGQAVNGNFVSFDGISTIRNIPIDPFPGKPYGRSLLSPAFFSALFLIGLLHDLRRVVAQQGYRRIELVVKLEELKNSMPSEVKGNADAEKKWINETIAAVSRMYESLEPDDAFVHTDVVEVNMADGALSGEGAFRGFDELIKSVERMAVRGLKSIPLLMGLDQSSTETNSNREWELYVAGIKSLQHHVEKILERLLTIALQVQGSTATVKFKFAELRASEMLRDAMTAQIEIANARALYDHGFVSLDAAAEMVTGNAADAPAPRSDNGGGSTVDPNLPLDGEERAARLADFSRMRDEMLSEIEGQANE